MLKTAPLNCRDSSSPPSLTGCKENSAIAGLKLDQYLVSMEGSYAVIISCEGGTDLANERSYLATS